MESYHVDEFRDADQVKFEQPLDLYKDGEKTCIIAYISPHQLRATSRWYPTFLRMARGGMLAAFFVDEAHSTVENSDVFRLDFKDAVSAINKLVSTTHNPNPTMIVPTVAMSATFRIPQQKSFNKLLTRFPTFVN